MEETAKASRSWNLWPIVVIEIETGTSRSEILGLRWEHIDEEKKSVFLPMTKNGTSRRVPISDKAFDMLLSVKTKSDAPFAITDAAIRADVGHFRHFKLFTGFAFTHHAIFDRAKQCRQFQVRFIQKILATKQQHRMLIKQFAQG